jgi:hypothetical protein
MKKLFPTAAALCGGVLLSTSAHAQITWQTPSTVTDTSSLDVIPTLYTGATLNQADDFGNSAILTVTTVGGQTINFAVGAYSTSAASGTSTELFESGIQTLTPAPGTGNANFDSVLQNDGWASGNGPTAPQDIQIGGLTIGQTYAIDIFTYDPRAGSAGRTQEYADTSGGTGNNSASFAYASPESVIGTFTASSAVMNVFAIDTRPTAGAGSWDTTVSALTLYAVPEPSTWAMLASGLAMLTAFHARRKA